MNFLDMLDAEMAAQERVLESHPAFIKLKALRATRALYVEASEGVAQAAAPSLVAAATRSRGAPLSGRSLEAVSSVIDILRERGKPMRTAQLMELVAQRGIEFAGNAPQNVLSSLLSRSPDVVSKGGHVGWALREWDTTGGDEPGSDAPPVVEEVPAQGREAGPGGGP